MSVSFRLIIISMIALCACMAKASAQDLLPVTDPVKLSLAAGYKATFTCSSVFISNRTPEQIAGDELNRIYPDYRAAFAQLPEAQIDPKAKTVSVAYNDNMPARHAVYTGSRGCMQLPTGARLEDFDREAYFQRAVSRRQIAASKKKQWPLGDKLDAPLWMDTEAGAFVRAQIDRAFDRDTYGVGTETTATLVIKDGEIIAEKYRDGFDMHTPQRTWSVAKSIAATIIGAAVQDGIISVGDKATFEHWDGQNDPRRAITLENFLHMGSGLDASPRGNRTGDIYFGGGRVVDHTNRRLIAAPGSRWYYANNDTMLAMRMLRERFEDVSEYHDYPFAKIFKRLGMLHTHPETDWNGDFILSSQVYTTARDLGRLGLLYLNNGVVNGEQILPEDWAAYVASPAPVQPPLRANGTRRFGYGAQFWLLEGFNDLPEGTYAALGNRGQSLVIVPSENMIIIRRGFDDNGGAQFDVAGFAGDIVKAMTQDKAN